MSIEDKIRDAMWAGDVDLLDEIAPCGCCCWEHTFSNCEARLWNGCRSGLPYGDAGINESAWKEHYAKFHGFTEAQFYNYET